MVQKTILPIALRYFWFYNLLATSNRLNTKYYEEEIKVTQWRLYDLKTK